MKVFVPVCCGAKPRRLVYPLLCLDMSRFDLLGVLIAKQGKGYIICSSTNDCLVLLVIFLRFEHHNHTVCQFQIVQLRQNELPVLEKSNVT